MTEKERAEKVVYGVIERINKSLLKDTPSGGIRSVPIVGSFDSLAMVNLVVDLEESIKQEFGKGVSLFEGGSSGPGPLKDIGSLVDYIYTHLEKRED